MSVIYEDWWEHARSSSQAAVVFRILDAAGMPYSGASPVVTASNGSIRAYRTGTVPGTYAVDVRTGTGNLTVNIAVAGVTESVVIPVY